MAGGPDSQKAKADDEPVGSNQNEALTPADSEQDMMKKLLLLLQQQQINTAETFASLNNKASSSLKYDLYGDRTFASLNKKASSSLKYDLYGDSTFASLNKKASSLNTFSLNKKASSSLKYDLYGDRTFASLNKKASSSLKYEQLVLGPALAYLYDAVQFSDDTPELLENQDKVLKAKLAFMEEKQSRQRGEVLVVVVAVSKDEIGVTTELEAQTRGTHRISLDADAERAQTGLAVGLAPGVNVPGTALPGSNFPFRNWAEGADSAGESAAEEGSLAHGGHQCGGVAVGLSWREDQLDARSSGTVRPRRVVAGSSCDAANLVGEGGEAARGQWGMGEGEKTRSRCKMETLKKLRRLAKQNDWCFSFDLKDGYHCVGIDLDFQRYMKFDVQGRILPVQRASLQLEQLAEDLRRHSDDGKYDNALGGQHSEIKDS
ncbi:hypothetical protein CYMTET_31284 [Cymbomonas tetramitiformis]|uniref:Uncharacterized protein n=1 Tax=Cymbomonas tetramitiformis TaxID=36881 RepID=A0AAE0FHF2_9CHLO|nr:hypothetical protein CYMTET_31284 [Cymbomonas tetramitiformis]